jgi:hypothetical protein
MAKTVLQGTFRIKGGTSRQCLLPGLLLGSLLPFAPASKHPSGRALAGLHVGSSGVFHLPAWLIHSRLCSQKRPMVGPFNLSGTSLSPFRAPASPVPGLLPPWPPALWLEEETTACGCRSVLPGQVPSLSLSSCLQSAPLRAAGRPAEASS